MVESRYHFELNVLLFIFLSSSLRRKWMSVCVNINLLLRYLVIRSDVYYSSERALSCSKSRKLFSSWHIWMSILLIELSDTWVKIVLFRSWSSTYLGGLWNFNLSRFVKRLMLFVFRSFSNRTLTNIEKRWLYHAFTLSSRSFLGLALDLRWKLDWLLSTLFVHFSYLFIELLCLLSFFH